MQWITRARVKVDRVACPWLIRKFVDAQAEFHFVPADQVLAEAARLGAIPYDVPGVELGHHGLECSFEAILQRYNLTGDPALVLLGKIVNGADTDNELWHQPGDSGLEAIAEGFRHLGLPDDHAINAAEWIVYDALYAYCQEMVRQGKLNGAFRLDVGLLFATRIIRLFAYGFLSIVLVLYLAQIGLGEVRIGLLLTLTLAGDAAITLWITTSADRVGRRRMLVIGAALMVMAGVLFALTRDFAVLVLAAIIGVISPGGNEIGPFLSIEQAALTQLLPDARRTQAFAWYNLVGSVATATGALCGGWLVQLLQAGGQTPLDAYRVVLMGYAGAGLILAVLFLALSPQVEVSRSAEVSKSAEAAGTRTLGLHKSKGIVFRLSALFALDAFAGGFVVQSVLVYWLYARFHLDTGALGNIFFFANLLAGVSALLAARIAARFGLINTMVYTHIPSNILLMLVPLMPTISAAIAVLLLRFSISQMDVPTRQSYTMAVIAPDERSAASGVTSIARSVGAALGPALSGLLLANTALVAAPFYIAGGLKIVYDLLLLHSFRAQKPPEEQHPA